MHPRVLALWLLSVACCFAAKEEKRRDAMGRDYWLYTPDNLDKSKPYWLVVGVHGHRGKGAGAAQLSGWADKFGNVIVVGPTFPSTGPYYQLLGGQTEKQLIDLQQSLSKEFRLYPKMFLFGHSGGAQYVHRFAGFHPQLVAGVAAASAGTWSPVPDAANGVLWSVSCGLKDTEVSAGATMSRIDGFRAFFKSLDERGFAVKPLVTDSGHRATKEVFADAEACFRTVSTGVFDAQRERVKGLAPAERERRLAASPAPVSRDFADGKATHRRRVNADGWTVSPAVEAALKSTRLMLDAVAAGAPVPPVAVAEPVNPDGMPLVK